MQYRILVGGAKDSSRPLPRNIDGRQHFLCRHKKHIYLLVVSPDDNPDVLIDIVNTRGIGPSTTLTTRRTR